ncbi:MAG: hypothetical protein GY821_02280, partial [Gammaproteobacteria bacterium]|nr:hypothetical protein [Gammaproteobacteria bacterium]
MRDSRMAKELPTLSWMVSNCHILWMKLLSEIIYHPALIENAFTWRNSATTEDQMWELDGSILSKIVPILESKIHKHRESVRSQNDPLEPRPEGKEHPFVEEMKWRAPDLWESLEPWREGLRAQLVINLLTEEEDVSASQNNQSRCILSRMLWHHGNKTRGIDHYLESIRTAYSVQASSPVCKWPDNVSNYLF